MFLGTTKYVKIEEAVLKKASYLAKPTTSLCQGEKGITFNRGLITRNNNQIELTQKHQCVKINAIDTSSPDIKSIYIRERARGAYVASTCQPEAAFSLSYTAQTTEPTKDNADKLNTQLE